MRAALRGLRVPRAGLGTQQTRAGSDQLRACAKARLSLGTSMRSACSAVKGVGQG